MPSSSLQALLVRAGASLERGRGAEAVQMLAPTLRSSLTRDEELTVRSMLAEAALLQDDLDQAIALMAKHRAIEDTVSRARHYGAIAKDALALFPAAPMKQALEDAVEFSIDRTH